MHALVRPVIFGVATILGYLGVVVVTTPALEPIAALNAAIQINPIVIFGMGLGVGLQFYLSDKAKMIGCNIGAKKRSIGTSSGSTAATSFFSFFSLVPLGCCGWWLYLLSLLPSVFGAGVSAVLIEYSQPLAYLGLAIIFSFNGIAAYRIFRIKKSATIQAS